MDRDDSRKEATSIAGVIKNGKDAFKFSEGDWVGFKKKPDEEDYVPEKIHTINHNPDGRTMDNVMAVSSNGAGIILRKYFFQPDNGAVCQEHMEVYVAENISDRRYKTYRRFLESE